MGSLTPPASEEMVEASEDEDEDDEEFETVVSVLFRSFCCSSKIGRLSFSGSRQQVPTR